MIGKTTALLMLCSSLLLSQPKQESYPELGFMVSSRYLVPSVGYWHQKVGIRLTGWHLNDHHFQYHLNLGYSFHTSEDTQHAVNLLTTKLAGSDPGADYRFNATGIAYSINYDGFFLEIWLAVPWYDALGNLENDPVIPCGYAGYLYRFTSE